MSCTTKAIDLATPEVGSFRFDNPRKNVSSRLYQRCASPAQKSWSASEALDVSRTFAAFSPTCTSLRTLQSEVKPHVIFNSNNPNPPAPPDPYMAQPSATRRLEVASVLGQVPPKRFSVAKPAFSNFEYLPSEFDRQKSVNYAEILYREHQQIGKTKKFIVKGMEPALDMKGTFDEYARKTAQSSSRSKSRPSSRSRSASPWGSTTMTAASLVVPHSLKKRGSRRGASKSPACEIPPFNNITPLPPPPNHHTDSPPRGARSPYELPLPARSHTPHDVKGAGSNGHQAAKKHANKAATTSSSTTAHNSSNSSNNSGGGSTKQAIGKQSRRRPGTSHGASDFERSAESRPSTSPAPGGRDFFYDMGYSNPAFKPGGTIRVATWL